MPSRGCGWRSTSAVAAEVVPEDRSQAATIWPSHRAEPDFPTSPGAFDDEGRRLRRTGRRAPTPSRARLLEDEGESVVELLPCRARRTCTCARRCRAEMVGQRGARLEFSPSAATTRSCGHQRVVIGLRLKQLDASSRARSCNRISSRIRPMPQKPWPVETVRTPL